MLPGIINLNIRSKTGTRFRLWLPLFVLWPVFLVFFLIALPFLIIADIVLRVSGARIRLFGMIGGVLSVLSVTTRHRDKGAEPFETIGRGCDGTMNYPKQVRGI